MQKSASGVALTLRGGGLTLMTLEARETDNHHVTSKMQFRWFKPCDVSGLQRHVYLMYYFPEHEITEVSIIDIRTKRSQKPDYMLWCS